MARAGILLGAAALVTAGTLSVKAAIDFESSFAGVKKTVNASSAELKQLSAGFREMAREIPVNVNELNKIGEAAGQLGIKNKNILSFTRTVADLGVTTDLTSEEAADSLARLANITQMPQKHFGRLGSTVVALGNQLASTESEIVAFGLRIAGAGRQVGLTEDEILAIGGALSSVGIEAEAGGTAISTVFIKMAAAANRGGKDLDAFAKVAGVSASEFQRRFKTDAAGALTAFVEGLARMKKQGKDVFGALDELGLGGIRVRDALLRASGAGDLLRESLKIGADAWRENTALSKEAEQRYGTTASQLQILKNNLNDAAIVAGAALLPAFNDLIGRAVDFAPRLAEVGHQLSGVSDAARAAAPVVIQFVQAFGDLAFSGAGTSLIAAAAAMTAFALAAQKAIATIAAVKLAMAGIAGANPALIAATAAVGLLVGGLTLLRSVTDQSAAATQRAIDKLHELEAAANKSRDTSQVLAEARLREKQANLDVHNAIEARNRLDQAANVTAEQVRQAQLNVQAAFLARERAERDVTRAGEENRKALAGQKQTANEARAEFEKLRDKFIDGAKSIGEFRDSMERAGHVTATTRKILEAREAQQFAQRMEEVARAANKVYEKNKEAHPQVAKLALELANQAAETAALTRKLQKIPETVGEIKDTAGLEARSVGSAISSGVAKGIAVNAAVAAARQLVRNAIEAARSEAKAKSPSAEMADKVGKPMGEGMVVGLVQASTALAARAADRVRMAIATAATVVHEASAKVGHPLGLKVIEGWLTGSAQLPTKMNEKVREAIEKGRQAIEASRGKFSETMSVLASDAMAAWDKAMAGIKTPSEKLLEQMDKYDRESAWKKRMDEALATFNAAQAGTGEFAAKEGETPEEAAEREKRRQEAMQAAQAEMFAVEREQVRFHLEEQAKAEREKLDERIESRRRKFAKMLENLEGDLAKEGATYKKAGTKISNLLAQGLREGIPAVEAAARAVAAVVSANLKLSSPAKEGPLSKDPAGWLRPLVPMLARGIDMRDLKLRAGGLAARVPAMAASMLGPAPVPALSSAGGAPSPGGSSFTLHVHVDRVIGTDQRAARELADLVAPELRRRVTLP